MAFKKKVKVVLFADCGDYLMVNGKLPEKGGTGKNGNVKRANCFTVVLPTGAEPPTIGGITVVEGATLRARIKNPGQNINNWIVNAG